MEKKNKLQIRIPLNSQKIVEFKDLCINISTSETVRQKLGTFLAVTLIIFSFLPVGQVSAAMTLKQNQKKFVFVLLGFGLLTLPELPGLPKKNLELPSRRPEFPKKRKPLFKPRVQEKPPLWREKQIYDLMRNLTAGVERDDTKALMAEIWALTRTILATEVVPFAMLLQIISYLLYLKRKGLISKAEWKELMGLLSAMLVWLICLLGFEIIPVLQLLYSYFFITKIYDGETFLDIFSPYLISKIKSIDF